jgi:2-polyprenyl-3-methyl-5-hydroxy-6-metoxy-1,4-benzoquinol methylase
MKPMHSSEWFDAFAATVLASIIDAELAGIASVLPIEQYRRVLDVGCGIGRIAGPLSLRGSRWLLAPPFLSDPRGGEQGGRLGQ